MVFEFATNLLGMNTLGYVVVAVSGIVILLIAYIALSWALTLPPYDATTAIQPAKVPTPAVNTPVPWPPTLASPQ